MACAYYVSACFKNDFFPGPPHLTSPHLTSPHTLAKIRQTAGPIRMKFCIVVAVSMSQLFAAVNTGSASGNQWLSADLYKRPDFSLLGHCAKK